METKRLDNTAIAVDAVLGTGLVKSIMEATQNYTFIKHVEDSTMHNPGNEYLLFWDSYNDSEVKIYLPITLLRLMDWILTIKQQRAERFGQIAKENQIKKALGL